MAADRLLMTPEDVARMLSISRSAVYEMVATGELPGIRLKRAIRIPAAGVESWVQSRLVQARGVPRAGWR